MNQYGSYGPRRSEMRQQKKKHTWVNFAIILTVIGIVFFSATLIFGNNNDESATADMDDQDDTEETMDETNEESNEDVTVDAPVDETVEGEETSESPSSDTNNDATEENGNDEEESYPELTSPSEVVGEGLWEPIGTVQEEPFVAVYERDHVNWEEMLRALKYATGLGEEMITWRINNGGDHLSAVGFVSDYSNRDTPFEVRLEWVTNEGWKPVYVKLLEENPYN